MAEMATSKVAILKRFRDVESELKQIKGDKDSLSMNSDKIDGIIEELKEAEQQH